MEPNRLRAFDSPSWLTKGATSARTPLGAPPARPATRRRSRSITARDIGRVGLILAVAGVLPFLNAEVRWQEVGLGMMCAGVGLVLLAATPGIMRSRVGAFGRSRGSAVGAMLAAPHWSAVPLIGAALLVVGLFLLVDAAASG